MTPVLELLSRLRDAGISLKAEEGQLRIFAPAGALTPALREELSGRKTAILALLKQAGGDDHPASHVIPRINRAGCLPLSFAQERLWFIEQLQPGTYTYNVPVLARLKGKLDVGILERSFGEILRRHEALRTVFVNLEGQATQKICPFGPFSLPVVDLQGLPEIEREEEVKRLALLDARQPFDLSKSPLIRAGLLKLAEKEHILLVNMHHIASDAWSLGVLTRELGIIYGAFLQRRPSPLPELPIQYVDFAVWQRQWLQGAREASQQLAYWKEQLTGAPPVLELPTDHPRPADQTPNGATEFSVLPQSLAKALRELSRREGVTLFISLLAAFNAFLHRYTGQEDLVIGMPIANRNRTEIEGLIGFFVNTLVLRTNLSGNPTFRELLGRVREVALGAYAHQDLTFEKLLQELRPERSTSHTPLFQVMFNFWNTPAPRLELPGLEPTKLQYHDAGAKVDLSLAFEDAAQGLTGRCLYNTDLWDKSTIIRMLGHYQTLLGGIVSNPDRRISDLPLLTEGERQQILVEWNRTEVACRKDRCLHELFAEQVERTPEAAAVVFGDQRLTYRELNEHANQLARQLQKSGVGPDTLVGICVERSLEMVIGLLGILKAGGAYVPLDSEYPKERLAFMLEDANVPLLLTQARLAGSIPAHKAKVIQLDEDWPIIAAESLANVRSPVQPHHLAYMIYTSGSTGRPKGALNTHRGICNRLLWMQDRYQLGAADTVMQKTPFSFDVSVWEFFWPLLNGAKLVVARPGAHQDPAHLVSLIEQHNITVLHFVPSMLRVFLEESGVERCHSLRHVICSGEALGFDLQERFFERLTAQLHNLYGPTEAAVDATHWTCQRNSPLRFVPIGRPVANTQTYILDDRMQPVPVGVAGELHLGGVQVGRGYHNRPELTAEKFIHDPFGRQPGGQLYKTGDWCRWLPDGNIEYLGRLDHQVKLRGFRIELGEIESVLARTPGVREAVVVLREDVPGNKRLVAYLTVKEGEPPKVSDLRGLLQAKLPEYMVPSAFVILERLPLTPNGKVDRKALPKPDLAQPESEKVFVAPRTPTEEALARIWCEILGQQQVGVHDNFFELGGHSLLATRIISRVRHSLEVDLPLRSLFEAPTLEGMASSLLRLAGKPAELEKRAALLLKVAKLSESEVDALLAAGS